MRLQIETSDQNHVCDARIRRIENALRDLCSRHRRNKARPEKEGKEQSPAPNGFEHKKSGKYPEKIVRYRHRERPDARIEQCAVKRLVLKQPYVVVKIEPRYVFHRKTHIGKTEKDTAKKSKQEKHTPPKNGHRHQRIGNDLPFMFFVKAGKTFHFPSPRVMRRHKYGRSPPARCAAP